MAEALRISREQKISVENTNVINSAVLPALGVIRAPEGHVATRIVIERQLDGTSILEATFEKLS